MIVGGRSHPHADRRRGIVAKNIEKGETGQNDRGRRRRPAKSRTQTPSARSIRDRSIPSTRGPPPRHRGEKHRERRDRPKRSRPPPPASQKPHSDAKRPVYPVRRQSRRPDPPRGAAAPSRASTAWSAEPLDDQRAKAGCHGQRQPFPGG